MILSEWVNFVNRHPICPTARQIPRHASIRSPVTKLLPIRAANLDRITIKSVGRLRNERKLFTFAASLDNVLAACPVCVLVRDSMYLRKVDTITRGAFGSRV
jgi:hypothetical protein